MTAHASRWLLYVLGLLMGAQAALASLFGSRGSVTSQEQTVQVQGGVAPLRKHDYKLGFKKPLYYNGDIPFWETFGSAFKAQDFVRLAASIPNTRGSVWSTLPNPYPFWEVEMSFKIWGGASGGKGLAFWYTKERGQDGPIYGNQDQWDGLGIWLDSANSAQMRNEPIILAVMNDGTQQYAKIKDPYANMLGSCTRDYRNTQDLVWMKVSYKNNSLSVYLDAFAGGNQYIPCFRRDGIVLPPNYYFGVSALSLKPADDHDIYSFDTYQLYPPIKYSRKMRPLESQKIKQGEEFQGLNEEQKQKIEKVRDEITRAQAEERNAQANLQSSHAAFIALANAQSRLVEQLEIVQNQLRAIGAPAPVDAAQYAASPGTWTPRAGAEGEKVEGFNINLELSRLQEGIEGCKQQQVASQHDILAAIDRLQRTIHGLEQRVSTQHVQTQTKLAESFIQSREGAKSTLWSFFKYTIYFSIAQSAVLGGGYLYYKTWVERSHKKFL
ncbi:hypothetical protein BZG36_02301 [Bifiguratus adelaidae]|uniref:L-type lectin-like domain-containing protein n=1 Tax=Bifiguratus adelaidae TaxID=1938954 RepID=A0A261Y3U7_9FUNG|nr:hypothetical protein BZG36_02301 [Bifiguratus adelaidae]